MTLGSEYRRIWFGNASSNLADGITFVALPLLGGDADPEPARDRRPVRRVRRATGAVGARDRVLVDRVDRRRLLVVANVSRAALFAALAALVLTGADPARRCCTSCTRAMGIIETLSDSAAFAVLPQAVRPQGLDRANSQVAATQTVVDEFVGPPARWRPVRGGRVRAVGAHGRGLPGRGLRLLAPAGLVRRPSDDAAEPPGGVLASIRAGAVWTWHHRVVRLLVVVGAVASVAYMIPFSYLVALRAGRARRSTPPATGCCSRSRRSAGCSARPSRPGCGAGSATAGPSCRRSASVRWRSSRCR